MLHSETTLPYLIRLKNNETNSKKIKMCLLFLPIYIALVRSDFLLLTLTRFHCAF
jgi:hypothetical protein